jgi:DNA (cytosine-5)-methyltransferase 1
MTVSATASPAFRRDRALTSPAESIRSHRHDAVVPPQSYSALSLYAGAGGLDLGFLTAGFEIGWAIDSDEQAVATYQANLGDHIVCGTLPETAPPSHLSPDVVIGGPPCQGFSVIGRMDPSDERSRHVFGFLDVVEQHKPRAFVLENVKALAVSPRWATTRDALRRRAEQLGYQVEIFILNAADYGVPQGRERMFMVGMSETRPVCPPPSTRGRPVTVREALASLPPYGKPGNDGITSARVVPASKPVMRPTAHKGSLLFNGSGRPLDLNATAKTIPASMGGNATPIIDQDELEHGAAPWVVEYHARLLAGKKPLKKAPARMRRITVQEAAALQSFPPWFHFTGRQVAQFRQIGNAVPPALAEHVAAAVRDTLRAIDEQAPPQARTDSVLALA